MSAIPKVSEDGTLPTEAITYKSYSAPPKVTTIALPTSGADLVKPDEVLVKISAASVNPVDVLLAATLPSFIGAKQKTMGGDFAGVIVKAGANTGYKPGDKVWGDLLDPVGARGSFAQYALFDPKKVIFFSKIPEGMSDVEAGSLGIAYGTGFGAITSHANNVKNANVLILGGGTTVGRSATQFAKYFGAKQIVTTCSAKTAPKSKALGADVTVDYSKGQTSELNDILETVKEGPFDLIVDTVRDPIIHGHFAELLKPAKENGLYVLIAGSKTLDYKKISYLDLAPSCAWIKEGIKETLHLSPYKYLTFTLGSDGNYDSYPNAVKDIWAKKQLVIDIDSTYKFKEYKDALEKVAAGKSKGKVVLEF